VQVLTEVSRRSNCVEIIRKGGPVVHRREERARWFYKVRCPKVKLEQEGEVSCERVAKKVFKSSKGQTGLGKGRGRVLGRKG